MGQRGCLPNYEQRRHRNNELRQSGVPVLIEMPASGHNRS